MKFSKILTVLGTVYAAGVAIAIKKRKDDGTSKLAENTSDSTLQNVVDEIKEIHKNTYSDVKNFFVTNFEDVTDFDSFKTRVTELSKDFVNMAEQKMSDLKDSSEDSAVSFKKVLEENYEKVKISLKNAEMKAKDFGEEKKETAEKFLAETKTKIDSAYQTLKEKISK